MCIERLTGQVVLIYIQATARRDTFLFK